MNGVRFEYIMGGTLINVKNIFVNWRAILFLFNYFFIISIEIVFKRIFMFPASAKNKPCFYKYAYAYNRSLTLYRFLKRWSRPTLPHQMASIRHWHHYTLLHRKMYCFDDVDVYIRNGTAVSCNKFALLECDPNSPRGQKTGPRWTIKYYTYNTTTTI